MDNHKFSKTKSVFLKFMLAMLFIVLVISYISSSYAKNYVSDNFAQNEVKKISDLVFEVIYTKMEDGWSRDDWHSYFDERAGLAEFDGGLSRDHAEARAFSCCVPEWLNRNPVHSAPGRCLGCGAAEHPHDPLLPFGVESDGHAWLHLRCWRAWADGRKAEAFSALAAIGIAAPANLPNYFGKNGDA